MLLNGTARCSRSRVFDADWNVLFSGQWAQYPYPITSYYVWIFDQWTFSGVTHVYPMHGFFQVSSEYSGQCGYGGGIGWKKPGQQIAWDNWPTST
jgi:hypothetical protein